MATFAARAATDMVFGDLPSGIVTRATSTEIVVVNGSVTTALVGYGITYVGNYVTSGVITGFVTTYGGLVAFEGYNFSGSAPVVINEIATGDTPGLASYILNGDDDVIGSPYRDVLAGYNGDDFISPGGGSDDVYGGFGFDTLVLSGKFSDYVVTYVSPGVYDIADTNFTNGDEGIDRVFDVEAVGVIGGGSVLISQLLPTSTGWFTQGANVALVAAAYEFFTDKIPTASGFEYLISSTANPNDLNDLYYANFNVENRYINFASNLGTAGEGATFFDRAYGSLNFADAVKTAYLEVMGKELMGAALDFFLNAQGFYQAVAAERVVRPGVDLSDATKIVAIGSILNEAVKLGQGPYADAVEVLVADVAPDGVSYKLGGDLFAVA